MADVVHPILDIRVALLLHYNPQFCLDGRVQVRIVRSSKEKHRMFGWILILEK